MRAALPRSELAKLDAGQQREPGQQLVGLSRSGKAYAQSLRDYETLTEDWQRLKRAGITSSCFSPEALEETIQFLLSPDNISPLSCGQRHVRLSADEVVTLPLLQARR